MGSLEPAIADIRIRSIGPDDRANLQRFYAELSPDSRHARFHGCCNGIDEPLAGFFCGPDHEHREGLAAVWSHAAGEATSIVGHLCLEPSGDGEVEMAVAVADDWQRHGVGRALLATAFAWARQRGFVLMRASMLSGNAEVLALLRSSGDPVSLSMPTAGVVEATVDLVAALPMAA